MTTTSTIQVQTQYTREWNGMPEDRLQLPNEREYQRTWSVWQTLSESTGKMEHPEAKCRCQNPLPKSDINQTPQRFAQVHCKEWLALKRIPLPDYDQHLNECHSQNRTHLSGSSAKFQYSIKQHSASRKCAARKWIARNTDREGPDRSQRRKGKQQGENYDYICIRQLVG